MMIGVCIALLGFKAYDRLADNRQDTQVQQTPEPRIAHPSSESLKVQTRSPSALSHTTLSRKAALVQKSKARAALTLPKMISMSQEMIPHRISPQLKCLAQAILYEARNEPLEGQLGVAQVVLNRKNDRRYPNTICAVVFQRNHRVCQFSFTCDGSMKRYPVNTRSRAWKRSIAIAQIAQNRSWSDVTGNALFYHATYVSPSWGYVFHPSRLLGQHIFYRG